MNLTQDDYEELQESNNRILAELEDLEVQGWTKKKDKIEQYVSNSRILLNAGKMDIVKKEFASFIISKLMKRNIISGTNGRIYELFSEDEKEMSKSRILDDEVSANISSGSDKTTEEIFNSLKDIVIKKHDNYTKHFDNLIKNSKEAIALSESLIDKYNESDELSNVMQKELGDIDKLIEEDLEIASVLSLARKNIDDRNKWGDYEKLIAQFLMAVGETKAELAKKLNYCSKYASIGIERNEELTRYWEFLGNCPKCKTDVHHFFDLQIQKYLKGEELDIDLPIKGY